MCCPAPLARQRAAAIASSWPTNRRASLPAHHGRITNSGSPIRRPAKRRSPAAAATGTKSSRSTARPTCRANSRRPSAWPSDNCVDLYANDLGLMAVVEGRQDRRLQRAGRRRHGRHAQRRQRPFRPWPSGWRSFRPEQVDRRGHGDRQGAARLRQPLGSQGGPAEIPDSQLGPRRLQGQGRGVLRPAARRAASRRRARVRRPHRLARAGRRQAGFTA